MITTHISPGFIQELQKSQTIYDLITKLEGKKVEIKSISEGDGCHFATLKAKGLTTDFAKFKNELGFGSITMKIADGRPGKELDLYVNLRLNNILPGQSTHCEEKPTNKGKH